MEKNLTNSSSNNDDNVRKILKDFLKITDKIANERILNILKKYDYNLDAANYVRYILKRYNDASDEDIFECLELIMNSPCEKYMINILIDADLDYIPLSPSQQDQRFIPTLCDRILLASRWKQFGYNYNSYLMIVGKLSTRFRTFEEKLSLIEILYDYDMSSSYYAPNDDFNSKIQYLQNISNIPSRTVEEIVKLLETAKMCDWNINLLTLILGKALEKYFRKEVTIQNLHKVKEYPIDIVIKTALAMKLTNYSEYKYDTVHRAVAELSPLSFQGYKIIGHEASLFGNSSLYWPVPEPIVAPIFSSNTTYKLSPGPPKVDVTFLYDVCCRMLNEEKMCKLNNMYDEIIKNTKVYMAKKNNLLDKIKEDKLDQKYNELINYMQDLNISSIKELNEYLDAIKQDEDSIQHEQQNVYVKKA